MSTERITKIIVNRGPSGIQGLKGDKGDPGPGVVAGDTDLLFEKVSDAEVRVGIVGADGIARFASLTLTPVSGIDPPGLDFLEQYLFAETATYYDYRNVPWGPVTWPEQSLGGQPLSQIMHIRVPKAPAPPGGRAMVAYYHATSNTASVSDGGDIDANVRTPAIEANMVFASVEYRSPVANYDVYASQTDLPTDDVGLSLQFFRSLHVALEMNRDNLLVVARSRGNLSIWQAMQPDMANPLADTYAKRQSSKIDFIHSVSGQVTNRTTRWAELFILPGERAAALEANPDDVRWGSAIDDLPNAVGGPPHMVMYHEKAYNNAFVSAALADDKHFPDNGRVMRDAYVAEGYRDRIVTIDFEPDSAEQLATSIPWFLALMEGAAGAEAWAIAQAKRRGLGLYYIRPDKSGAAVQTNGTQVDGVPVVDSNFGVIVDGKLGLANRALTAPQGTALAQTTATNKPIFKSLPSGWYGTLFEANDRMGAAFANAAQTQTSYAWTLTKEVSTPAGATPSTVLIGQPNLALEVMTLAIAHQTPGWIRANDVKGFRHLADVIGSTHYSV